MFKSINPLQIKAENLVKSYASWTDSSGEMEGVLNKPNGNAPMVIELEAIRTRIDSYARLARELTVNPAFGELSADLREDVTAIAEECEAAIPELDAEVDPDLVWQSTPAQEKKKLLQRRPVTKDKATNLRARLRGEKRRSGVPA